MTMEANRIVALCEQVAYFLREDLTLIEAGHLRLQLFGTPAGGDYRRLRLSRCLNEAAQMSAFHPLRTIAA